MMAFLPLVSANSEVRAPAEKEARRLDRARQDHAPHPRVRHQRPAGLVVGAGQELEDIARDAGVPQAPDQLPAGQHGLGRGLEDDGIAGGQRGEHAARGNGERKVPRRGHDHHAQRLHAAIGHLGGNLAQRAGVVAGEVDGLGDLHVGLRHRLGAIHDHRADQVAPAPPELRRARFESRLARREGQRGPSGLGRPRGRQRALDVLAPAERVAVGGAPGARGVAPVRHLRSRARPAADLERDLRGRPLAPARHHRLDPRAIGGERPVGLRVVAELRGRRRRLRTDLLVRAPVLRASRRVGDRGRELEGGQEPIALGHPLRRTRL
jgi:hypothetical protein